MKKIISLILMIIMMLSLAGCGTNEAINYDIKNKGDAGSSGILGALADGYGTDMDGDFYEEGMLEKAPDAGDPGEAEPDVDVNQQPTFSAGTLTAGEWKDAKDIEFWTKLLNRNDWYQLMEGRNLYTNKVVSAYVHDEEGNPCYNVETQLVGANGEIVYTARTDVNGMAYMLYDLNKTGEKVVSVIVNNKEFMLQDKSELDIAIESTKIDVTALDLMFMIDTTGSMGDELSYLQEELEDVVKRVADGNKALSINVSVNFYRDESDDYVVLDYDFYSDITKSLRYLKQQQADGGGDYPEAVHTALNNAVNEHQWRKDAVKLCFLVLDAPPHSEDEIKGINAQITNYVMDAASEGIRIIPIASSGVDTETEFLLRSFAIMTGGTYVFLTNHSGIGGEHLEPTIGEYEVEALNELMIRVISEYCGIEY